MHVELLARGWPARHTTYFTEGTFQTIENEISYSGLVLDLIVSIATLIVLWLVVEYLIRRREGRRA